MLLRLNHNKGETMDYTDRDSIYNAIKQADNQTLFSIASEIRSIFNKQQKTIDKKVYNRSNVEKVYLRLHNTIKFTVVLGIVYRITHFFPFLEEVSAVMLVFVILFFVVACMITLREVWMMLKTKNNN